MARLKSIYVYYAPALVWGILIFYFSLMPGADVPDLLKSIEGFIIHMAIYFFLAILIFFGSSRYSISKISSTNFTIALIIILIMGGILEPIQEYCIPNRVGEWEDVFANMLGGVVAILLWRQISKS